jgi:trans-o-hydroxybenzylidenepyruvate hydratase-aldolase
MTTIQPSDLRGVIAMVPSFTTDDGTGLDAKDTVDIGRLREGVDRLIADGVDAIATTGSFGEVYNLLPDELATLTAATVDVVAGRVPLFIGCTEPNPRQALERLRMIRDAGAPGAFVGAPYYMPQAVDNAVRYFEELADLFPDLAFMLYHNPGLHHVTLPVPAVVRLAERPNIVAIKDSHRDVVPFTKLVSAVGDRLQVYVYQAQLFPYALLGATGCWSINVSMGPWPILQLRDACAAGDWTAARAIAEEVFGRDAPGTDPRYRELQLKIAVRAAGYVDPGPLRAPFWELPDEVVATAQERGARWRDLAEDFRVKPRFTAH